MTPIEGAVLKIRTGTWGPVCDGGLVSRSQHQSVSQSGETLLAPSLLLMDMTPST